MDTTDIATLASYTKDYKDYCFTTWWRLGRPSWTDLTLNIEKFNNRMHPPASTLSDWAKAGNWVERADEWDKDVVEEVKSRFVTEKALMLSRHAGVGKSIIEMGMEYLESNPISSQGAALRAVQLGVAIEAEAAQIEKLVSSVAKMDDKQVDATMRKLLDKAKIKKDVDDRESAERD